MENLRLGSLLRLLTLILLVAFAAGPAHSQGEETAVVTAFDATDDGASVRIEIDGAPQSEIILLQNPNRIALDLADTVTAVRPPAAEDEGAVSAIRDGLVARDRYRILFELRRPAVPSFTTRSEDGSTVLELQFEPASLAEYRQAVNERMGRIVAPAVAGAGESAQERFTVVIDPGHGGSDLGAVGEGGTLEKELNLAFASALGEALKQDDERIEVVMTREDDVLIPLAERSAMARRAGADLFVSVHADSIRYKDLRGATVYTLSATASDELASEVAEGENAADRFVGTEWTQDTPEIHDILVDLVRRETESLSQSFADELVIEMRRADIRLINNPKRSAGFRVLMAPDVPSVLLEMGYLSNVEDEKLMGTPEWQAATAEVLAEAIRGFLTTRSALAGRG